MRAAICALALFTGFGLASSAGADWPELPWRAEAPRVEGESIRVTAVATADLRIGRYSARRRQARADARRFALSRLHRWLDDALVARPVSAPQLAALHDSVEEHAVVVATRPLADAGAAIVLELPTAALRSIFSSPGLPWSP